MQAKTYSMGSYGKLTDKSHLSSFERELEKESIFCRRDDPPLSAVALSKRRDG